MSNYLADLEKQVMFHKATEPPFTGKYDKHFENGVYVCKNCRNLLFYSRDKFNSGCGWPAFDDSAIGAVDRLLDADGQRIEIVCANCGIHLGHVFEGEAFTPKNTRHCVNSASLDFVPACNLETIVVGGGCFWGIEYLFRKLNGILSVTSGYCGGNADNPSYKQVCSGITGHYEVVEVVFEKTEISLEEVLKYFFEIHDFEQVGGQGPDIGQQYESVIFYQNDKQKSVAQKLIDQLSSMNYSVATKLLPAKTFYPAELYHQRYYQRTKKTPYCHFYKKIF